MIVVVEAPILTCMTKATTAEEGSPRYSANWVVARRALFRMFRDRIECGDWIIRASEVTDAILYETRVWFVIPARVLRVSTSSRVYQFGFNPWVRFPSEVPFSLRVERVRMRYSRFSLVVRGLALTYLLFLLVRWIGTS